jgi:protein-tyrosine phosphatase
MLCELGITHILVASSNLPLTYESTQRFVYLRVGVPDTPESRIIEHFEVSNEFIDTARRIGNVLVHCFAGKSRSATLVCAYLIATQEHSYESALALLQSVRPHVQPNHGFAVQLAAYERKKQKLRDRSSTS